MLHLPADRLAELVDNEATPQELAHLRSCTACARERSAFLALRQLAAAERDRDAQPLLEWDTVRRGLVDEGMIAGRTATAVPIPVVGRAGRGFNASRWSLRLAASFALVATGVAVGRFTERPGGLALLEGDAATATTGAVTAANGTSFASRDAAMNALLRAQQDYQRAAAYLVASDTTVGQNTPTMFKQRLAALDELMGVTRSALTLAPHDPVMNSYYLATIGAREATIQQLQLALPVGTKIDRF